MNDEPTVDSEVIDLPTREVSEEERNYISALEKNNALIARIVPPHTKVSRIVTEEDINNEQFLADMQDLYQLCFTSHGLYGGAYAMHHSQIDDKDPLSMFVLNSMLTVINPSIGRHSGYTRDSKEACMSFSGMKMTTVQRWQKIDVTYQTIINDPDNDGKYKLSEFKTDSISGNHSLVFQHEIDHGNAKFIYELT